MDKPEFNKGDIVMLNYKGNSIDINAYLCNSSDQIYSSVWIKTDSDSTKSIGAPFLIGGFQTTIDDVRLIDGRLMAIAPPLLIDIKKAWSRQEIQRVEDTKGIDVSNQEDYTYLIKDLIETHANYDMGLITLVERNRKFQASLIEFYHKVDSHNNPIVINELRRMDLDWTSSEEVCQYSWSRIIKHYSSMEGRIGFLLYQEDYDKDFVNTFLRLAQEVQHREVDKSLQIGSYFSGYWLTRPTVLGERNKNEKKLNILIKSDEIASHEEDAVRKYIFEIKLYDGGVPAMELIASKPWEDEYFDVMLNEVIDQGS